MMKQRDAQKRRAEQRKFKKGMVEKSMLAFPFNCDGRLRLHSLRKQPRLTVSSKTKRGSSVP